MKEIIKRQGRGEKGKFDWGLLAILTWLALPGMGAGAWLLQNWSVLNGIEEWLQFGVVIGCGVLGIVVGVFLLLLLPFLGMVAADGDPNYSAFALIAAICIEAVVLPIIGGAYLLNFIGVF